MWSNIVNFTAGLFMFLRTVGLEITELEDKLIIKILVKVIQWY
jgi:hypothetical protein